MINNKNKHIAIISYRFPPHIDSIGHYAYNLASEFQKEGHDIVVFCGTEEEEQEYEITGIKVHAFVKKWNINSGQNIVKKIKKGQFDCVLFQYDIFTYHPHGTSFTLVYMLYKLSRFVPVYTTFHEVRNKMNFRKPLRVIKTILQIFTVKTIHHFSKKAITSNPLYQSLLRLPYKEAAVIPVGSNIPFVHFHENDFIKTKQDLGIEEGAFIMGTFGRQIRNIDVILKTFSQRKPSKNKEYLLLIGKINSNVLNKIHLFIQENNLQKHIIITGELSAEQVSLHLQLLDLFLILEHTHSNDEWTGISGRNGSLAAAISHQLNIIGTEGERTNAFLKDSEDIRLIEKLNNEAINKKMDYYVNKKNKPRQSKSFNPLLRKLFDWKSIFDRYKNTF